MKAFRLTGNYPVRKNTQSFCIDIVAKDDVDARHRLYSRIGSRHRVQRRHINIEDISEINPTLSSAAEVIAKFRDTHDFSSKNEEE
jgi:ribosomal protein L20A (L18A)